MDEEGSPWSLGIEPKSGHWSFEGSESIGTHSVPCSVQTLVASGMANPTSPWLHPVRRESPAWMRRAEQMGWGIRRRCVEREALLEGKGWVRGT